MLIQQGLLNCKRTWKENNSSQNKVNTKAFEKANQILHTVLYVCISGILQCEGNSVHLGGETEISTNPVSLCREQTG